MRGLGAAALVLMLGCSQGKSVEVGAEGGVLQPSEAPWAQLRVPAGALRRPTGLSIRQLQERFPGTVGPALEAGPHGTRFEHPVALRFSPTPADLGPGIHFGELRVATLQNGRWEILPTSFPAPGVVEGLTTHFSTFALVAPCHASGLAHDFPLSACPTFSPRIETSADVDLDARAFPVTLMLNIRATPGAGSVNFTVSGLRAAWTYFLSRDGNSQLDALTADDSGVLHFTQDAAAAHILLLMAQHGSIQLSPSSCPGVWEDSTRTCTLTQDYLTPPISLGDDNTNLDCAGHTVGGPTRASVAIISLHNGHTLRNCTITNSDVGIATYLSNRLTVADVAITMPAQALGAGEAIVLTNSDDATFRNLSVSNFQYGMTVSGGGNLLVQGATFQVSQFPIDIGTMSAVSLNDVVVDGAQLAPIETPLAAVQLSGAHGVNINRLTTRGVVSGVSNIVAATFDSDVVIADSSISQANVAIRLDGPGTSFVVGSTLSQNSQALQLNGGTNYVFHNNIFGNGTPAVVALGPVDLYDNRSGSPTFGQGNFWGHACPGLFLPTDTNSADVIDASPYARADAWRLGDFVGCPALAPPVFTSPVDGAFLNDSTPTFRGQAEVGSSVDLLEDGGGLGQTAVLDGGVFAFTPLVALSEGPHQVIARERQGAAFSQGSAPLSFTIDTVPPVAPTLTAPRQGAVLNDSSAAVSGSAEPGSTVGVLEGTASLGSTTALPDGSFLLSVSVGSGAHSVRAVATDAAGNASVASAARSFTVSTASVASPLVSAGGTFRIVSVQDAPDPFTPAVGEVHTVRLDGEVLQAPGAPGNHIWQANVRRSVVFAATGAVVATFDTTAPVFQSPGRQDLIFSLASGWDGRTALGGLAPAGAYESNLTVWIIRDPLSPPTPTPIPGGICGPAAQPVSGPCKVDTIHLLNVNTLLEPPTLLPPILTTACRDIREVCDGLDNNCNGQIDEGIACDVIHLQQCAPSGCLPVGCNGATCGTIPDGCGGLVVCGGTCP